MPRVGPGHFPLAAPYVDMVVRLRARVETYRTTDVIKLGLFLNQRIKHSVIIWVARRTPGKAKAVHPITDRSPDRPGLSGLVKSRPMR